MSERMFALVALLLFGGLLTAGCASRDTTISKEEQQTTREHKNQYEEKTGF